MLRKFEQDNVMSGQWASLPFSPLQIEYLRLRNELVVLPQTYASGGATARPGERGAGGRGLIPAPANVVPVVAAPRV